MKIFKFSKQILAFTLAVAMVVGGFSDASVSYAAEVAAIEPEIDEAVSYDEDSLVIIEGEIDADGVEHNVSFTYTTEAATYNSDAVTFSDYSDIAEYIRQEMVARNEEITFTYSGSVYDIYENLTDVILEEVYAHTGVANEGDYLYYNHGYATYSFKGTTDYAIVTVNASYYTTAAQEEEFDEALEEVLTSLALDGKTDYDKICAIYDYITSNVAYDYDNLNDDDYKLKYTAYAALMNKTAVCQGFALLFYRMSLEAGVDARIIAGTGNGGAHAWNIVQLGEYYYLLDATWDGYTSNLTSDYLYFLKGSENFAKHTASEEFTTEEFEAQYVISATDCCRHSYVATEATTDYIIYTCSECGESCSVEAYDNGLVIVLNSDYSNYVEIGGSITLIVTASCKEGDITYQWYRSTYNGSSWFANIEIMEGETKTELSLTNIQESAYYRCHVEDSYGNFYNWGCYVYVDNGLTVIASENNITAEVGDTVTLEVTASCYSGDILSYSWATREYSDDLGGILYTRYTTYDDCTSISVEVEGDVIWVCGVTDEYGNYTEIKIYVYVEDTHQCSSYYLTTQTIAATCTEDGYKITTCGFCGKESSRTVIAATGHSYSSDEGYNEPTCSEEGTCVTCGEIIAATGHNYTSVTKDSTCTEEGYTYTYCKVCGDNYKEYIEATGHSYETILYQSEATCINAGYICYSCSSCGDLNFIIEEATGHIYDSGVVTEATCLSQGYTTYTCSVCGYYYNDDIVDCAEHSYDNGTVVGATCTTDGYTEYICTECGNMKWEDITLATGHNYILTSTTSTQKIYTCSACGDTYSEDKSTQTITASKSSVSIVYGNTATVTGTTSGDGAISYSSSNTSVATVNSSGKITAKGAGTATITITAAGTDDYQQATKTITVTVTKASQTISAAFSSKTLYAGSTSNNYALLKATTTGNGKLTYKSSNTKVVKVSSSGKITVVGKGTATITITAAATSNYKSATKTVKITVKTLSSTKISSVKNSKSKKITVKWKKVSAATGYEIQYSTSKKFTSSTTKTVTISKASTTSKTISGLKKGKTYYVRVRTYVTIGGKTYSSWSTVKKIKVTK